MKKIININLSSRLIPMEDTAYELLKNYLESLKRHFSREDGGDEIVSDIEDRIAELFQEKLKKGAHCITDDDVQQMIGVMGRPEQLEEETGTEAQDKNDAFGQSQSAVPPPSSKRLMRDENDKVLGGVCSGIAAYWGIDPVIIRIITFLLICAWGTGLIVYIILWIVLPSSRSLQNPVRKRLYRNPDNKVVGGVCSGIAAYLNIDPVVARIVFILPLLGVIFTSIFRSWHAHWFPGVFFPLSIGFLPTMVVLYIILWISVPLAVTVAEKLEMRGEKVDLHSLTNAMKGTKEEKKNDPVQPLSDDPAADQAAGSETTPNPTTESFAQSAPYYPYTAPKKHSSVGKVLGTMFKIAAYIILGLIVISLCIALIGMAGGFIGAATFSSVFLPYKGFILHSTLQHILAWPAIVLTMGIPVVAIIWLFIKLFTGFRPKTRWVGLSLSALWVIGIICAIWLCISIGRDFKMNYRVAGNVSIDQPSGNKLLLSRKVSNVSIGGWNAFDDLIEISDDTMILKTLRLEIQKSQDDSFHVQLLRASNGYSVREARDYADAINLSLSQDDSVLYIPEGFSMPPGTTFRNQRVVIRVFVPENKEIKIDNSLHRMRHFHGWNDIWDDDDYDWDYNDNYNWDYNETYKMTPDGLKNLDEPASQTPEETPDQQNPTEKKATDSTGKGQVHDQRSAAAYQDPVLLPCFILSSGSSKRA